jgi:hypothetical protein
MIISLIFVLIFVGVIISGCVDPKGFPVWTRSPDVSDEFHRVQLIGQIGVQFCKAKNHTFVYDNESHENWKDYLLKEPVTVHDPETQFFYARVGFSEIKAGVTYYVRAVVYCYDFKKPFEKYAEGYYQGDEKTFIVN